MSKRADELAERLEATTEAVLAAVDSREADQDANRVLTHHLATSHALVLSLAQAIVNQEPLPSISWEMMHAINEQHVRANTTVGPAEARQLLRSTTTTVAEAIRQLTDDQLARQATWGLGAENGPVTAADIIEAHLLRHAEEHLANREAPRLP